MSHKQHHIAIRVNNLSKLYKIGALRYRHDTLRDHLVHGVRSLFSRNGAHSGVLASGSRVSGSAENPAPDKIWALRDVSFEVNHGEVVGIIGRNGAGKSTLFKILSRITEPTDGRVEIYGRVGSLLEVGTGFHPELSGRENIYLNGAILGMKKAEIENKFDEIVSFAEIEKFIDTPVKRYSSGMYVRLAFAVAAHLEPEILIVDEVLAVGDANFQKKCLGKIGEIAGEGRTVLLVSHNLEFAGSLCNRAVLLHNGRIVLSGATDVVISHYLAEDGKKNGDPFGDCQRTGNGIFRIKSFHMESPKGEVLDVISSGSPVVFAFEFSNEGCNHNDKISFGFSVHNSREVGLFHYYSHFSGFYYDNIPLRGYFKCLIPELSLAPGKYLVMCRGIRDNGQAAGEEVDWPRVFIPIVVVGGDFYGTGETNVSTASPILVKGKWSMVKANLLIGGS